MAYQTEAGDAAAFLINRDDWLGVTQIAQIINQFPQLLRTLNVASKQNKAPWLSPTK
jgi:hypothetical protein